MSDNSENVASNYLDRTNQISVLLVDDCSAYRMLVRRVLSDIPDVEVVGEAANGLDGVKMTASLKPDLLILDVEMPELDGIEVLAELARMKSTAKAIMLSSLTEEGAEATADALMHGAFDFIRKPVTKSMEESSRILRDALLVKIRAFMQSVPRSVKKKNIIPQNRKADRKRSPVDAICIGSSTGGPMALKTLLTKLPPSIPVPIFIVQHMPPVFTKMLAKNLDENCELSVCEATDKMVAEAGKVYIAPGGSQMCLENEQGQVVVRVNDDPAELDVRPSVNYFFRSAAAIYGRKMLAIILTGMGCDGRDGSQLISENGGRIVAQDEKSCVVYGMPKSVVDAGIADMVAPLGEIAEEIKAVGLISSKRQALTT